MLGAPQNKTVGIIGAGRIGAAYARMMVEGHKMNLLYYDPYPNNKLEQYIKVGGGSGPWHDGGQAAHAQAQRAPTPASWRRLPHCLEQLRNSRYVLYEAWRGGGRRWPCADLLLPYMLTCD